MPIPFGRGARRPAPTVNASGTRKALTDRLGIPETATDAEILASVDQATAKSTPTAAAPSADDALYAAMYGDAETTKAHTADDELYRKMFG